jgi:hypothetical protein
VSTAFVPGEGRLEGEIKGLGQLFTYLVTKEKEVRIGRWSKCAVHRMPKREIRSKRSLQKAYKTDYPASLFLYAQDGEKAVDGQTHCSSRHIHSSTGRHFEFKGYVSHFQRQRITKDSQVFRCHKLKSLCE